MTRPGCTQAMWSCRVILLGAVALVAHGCSSTPAPADGLVRSPADVQSLIAELKRHTLRLTGDATSAAAQFDVRLHWGTRLPDGTAVAYDCLVARNADQIAVVLFSPGGLPFCYMTHNLLLKVADDGQLVALTRGEPFVAFERIADQDRFQASAGFLINTREATVRINLGSIVEGLIVKATRTTADGRILTLQTDRAQATIGMAPPGAANIFPLTSLAVHSTTGASAMVEAIHFGADPPVAFGLTLADVKRVEIPVREAYSLELEEVPLLVPNGFDTNASLVATARRLSALFHLPAPATKNRP